MKTLEFPTYRWIAIDQTSYADVEFLEEHYHFHPLDLKDCLGVTQRPKIDSYSDYLFLVFHFPQYDRAVHRIRIEELNVFLGRDFLITLTNQPNATIADLFASVGHQLEAGTKSAAIEESSGYLLYRLLDRLTATAQPVVDIIGERLTIAEDEVFSDNPKNAAMDLSNVRRNILTYQRLLEPQLHVIGRLVDLKKPFIAQALSVYFDDIHDALERTWGILNGYKDTIQGLDRTNEALTSRRLNDIIKTLTMISVLTIIPSLIINIYSMNIHLPFASNPRIFFILTSSFFFIMILTYLVLRRRRLT